MSFSDAANPEFFKRDPKKFWFFYGHRYKSYSETKPHEGFRILKEFTNNSFVFTSNVDNHFLRAGFPEHSILECHGSIFHF